MGGVGGGGGLGGGGSRWGGTFVGQSNTEITTWSRALKKNWHPLKSFAWKML